MQAEQGDVMAEIPTPHDRFFRALLSDPERARDFMRDHLPNGISGQLADSLPEIVQESFVDEALAGSQSDLLLKARLTSGGDAFVYVLVEHKSTSEPGLPLQLASYMVRIWKRHAGTSAARLRALPPIVPVVVYHGAANWTAPASLRDMIDADDPELDFLPGSGYILRNLRAMDIAALSRNAELRAGFMALSRRALATLIKIALSLPEGDDLKRQLFEYILHVYKEDLDELLSMLRNEGQTELEAIVGTIAETLLEQGEMRGLAKGKAETLLRQAGIRFGDLPPDRVDEIRAADAATLDRWLEAMVVAETLEDVLEPRKRH